jgi:hypothetical protein
MSFQPLFRRFHEAIQLKRFGEEKELREKRDRILTRLRDRLKVSKISFEFFNQGSYEMGTGVKPLSGDYDIDIGVQFTLDRTKHDPVEVKGWVFKAVEEHTARVEWRRPCITVYYQEAGEAKYHVDLAVLVKAPSSKRTYLALGKQHSEADQRQWQEDGRQGFMEELEKRFSGEDCFQFRRVIRYLKRWKDVHFQSGGRAAPSGLALTVAARKWFRAGKVSKGGKVEYDDLAATSALVQAMLQGFGQAWENGRLMPRLTLEFPNAPHDDVFARMSSQKMVEFQGHLTELRDWLEAARKTGSVDPLRRAFGDAFPKE